MSSAIVTTKGYHFAMPSGGYKFHKVEDGSAVAQCGFQPTGKRGRWAMRVKELTGPARTCEACLLQPSIPKRDFDDSKTFQIQHPEA